ncbi:uncharacterized protein M421DRAFT_423842 [Didymella exigua CBS 183.55]|uniref:Uncharacterized protein n=1 Tax=Didymella exigua CBS 183.55 TaxID=1150837 RepID=A0A6A5RC79_9PLEO|nr:uncharacterized protein M421DRAFT_423842 [Didymella exigua CBS 183.55]KAF1925292.1 hypothetical protein M421DRAFT_423842 [Didymella exigua CBS 183.55]
MCILNFQDSVGGLEIDSLHRNGLKLALLYWNPLHQYRQSPAAIDNRSTPKYDA